MKTAHHKVKELHFHPDFEDDLLRKEKQFTYRNGDRLEDYEIDGVVDMIIDDVEPRNIGKCRILAMAVIPKNDVDRYVLRYLELYYVLIEDYVTLIEFQVL